MPDTWIIDMTQYLDASGRLPSLPGPVHKLAEFFGAIVASVSSESLGTPMSTLVRCRRHPGRKKCIGEILAVIERRRLRVEWECPVCGDNGVIHNWRGTVWDCSARGVLQ